MKVLIIPETEGFFCFHARTEIFDKWKCIDTFQEVNKENHNSHWQWGGQNLACPGQREPILSLGVKK